MMESFKSMQNTAKLYATLRRPKKLQNAWKSHAKACKSLESDANTAKL